MMAATTPAANQRLDGLLDMSLDQIIEAKPRGGRRNGGGGGGADRSRRPGGRGNRPSPYGSTGSRNTGGTAQQTPAALSDKIVVSNLAKGVTQEDVHELFTRIGPVRSAQLNYDAQGRSKGVATVIFNRARDAATAIREYHNRALDNKPMKIELIVRADAAAAPIARQAGGTGNPPRRQGGAGNGTPRAGRNGTPSGRRGDRRRGAGGVGATHKKAPKTQDELDAEMEAYMKDDGGMDIDTQPGQAAALPVPATNGVNLALANALG
ncbi:uncharacterized protein EV422DRAFT_545740 [Fimicolochytrium jonesii]|uniref:uncharacterized protein n=1 Tax=Fimicolochytrium jonesii TaxID=1396493 RepID=UPI0022FEDCDA|nr:uncharacterized protein EV422DRAFT_545740 [Fimicolochytrium jonesii]KAI8816363.1 hypothetical protein EV422DRAFT_545740 [Fimicolochytrium jonesii]